MGQGAGILGALNGLSSGGGEQAGESRFVWNIKCKNLNNLNVYLNKFFYLILKGLEVNSEDIVLIQDLLLLWNQF